LRGAGDSSVPTGPRPYALARLAADAAAVIEATSPDRPVHLVGHDWGAIQGWEFLYAEPTYQRISSFTCVSGASFDQVGVLLRERLRRPTPARLWHLLGQARRSWYMLMFQSPRLFAAVWPRLLAPRWGWLLATREGVPRSPAFPAPTLAQDGVNLVGLYWRTPLERILKPRRTTPVSVPVQVIRPVGDRFVTEHTLEGVERFAPDLTRASVPGGHWAPRTYPGRLAELITEHVERAEGADRAERAPEADRI
jgi:pimeloyl-ACP methyl ester carboxylesterase